jgi:hypothetical protein
MKLSIAAVFIALGLAACTTSMDADACAGYGYRPGTAAHAECVERAALYRRAAVSQAFVNWAHVRAAQAAALQHQHVPSDRIVCTRNVLTGSVICRAM